MVDVTLSNVSKSFGSHEVLKNISLEVPDRSFVAFVGPSGCGKSTLLRVIAGLESASSGEIRFGERRMNDVPAPDRGAAMVFQSYALYPHMTVWENMSFSLRLKGVSRKERRAQTVEVARLLQLDPLLDRKPGQLSGGQRQRVAIGRALMREPEVFLFDEPLSNLDAALRSEMRVELSRLHHAIGNTMIYVTHDQVEAMTMADQIVVLKDGEVMQVGAPMELYARPASRFVAEFIGAPKINILDGMVENSGDSSAIRLANGARALLPSRAARAGQSLSLGVRPEDVVIEPAGDSRTTAHARGTVDVIERHGADALIYFKVDGLPEALRVKSDGRVALAHGDTADLGFRSDAFYLFDEQGAAMPGPTSTTTASS
ncbi:hypothetical protein OG2516_18005 [Oceanicola granulosus HTCC2516]|uniref:ABC transporter domain-containing protein n=1 Tax=Oceanicola granulosus (strain ATCC BAA-861 / DSM 15982 / KCTC 12143 / HTCC2516) TaxID=314256 RepID=Q2CEP3_OCEGH|nr:ABC transporter ATP-binding protein [Oceanicola granulosus]EAR51089.1 hypothetical protein OG2516_18005 [Oceanicola granulosus HTCC2516]